MAQFGNFSDVTISFVGESSAIANARKNPNISHGAARDFVFALISNRKVFDTVSEYDDYDGIEHVINEVLTNGSELIDHEVKAALADYDKIMGIKPAKTETEVKIDKLQAELDQLRATLRNA
jgi:hypothetical protein